MRRSLGFMCLAFAVLPLGACGGKQAEPPGPVPECQRSTLVASAPLSLGAPGALSAPASIAGTPEGDRFLVVGTADAASHATVAIIVTVGSSVNGSAPFGVLQGSVPAFDGSRFVVVAPDPSSGLDVQHFDTNGAVIGPATTVAVAARPGSADVLSVVSTSGGLALTWRNRDPLPEVHATLVGDDGSVVHDSVVSRGVFDPYFGTGPFGALALLGGRTVLLTETIEPGDAVTLSDLGWAGEAPSTSAFTATEGHFPPSLVVARDRLFFTAADAQGGMWMYAGTLDGSFSPVWSLPPESIALSADGCGRVINVARSALADPPRRSSIVAQGWAPGSTPVNLGAHDDTFVPSVVIAPTATGFGVVWDDASWTLQFTSLTWQQ